MSEDIAIRVDNVSKEFKLPHEKTTSIKGALVNFHKRNRSFEKQSALKNINFDIKKGEFFGIVGRNGSGKSTLLKLLAGIYTPSKGNITINGKLTPFIELGVGFNQELTGRENVYLNGALLGFNRKAMNEMYEDIVKFAELSRFMDQKLKNYSSGMQVRLAFSIAIRAQTDILLLDEVLAVGDAAFQQKCFDYFEELKREKKTVVFVSHDMSALRRFCTSAIYIKDGKLTHEGSALDIADVYVAENIQDAPAETVKKGPKLSKQHKIRARISEPEKSMVKLDIIYESKDDAEMYVGISVIRDGISVAEITTALQKPLKGNGTVSYFLDTSIFNAGTYRIDAALFLLKNRKLIAVGDLKNNFVIKGNDITKGAALKLSDTWLYQ